IAAARNLPGLGRSVDREAAHSRASAPGDPPGLPPAAGPAAPPRLALDQRQDRGVRPGPPAVHDDRTAYQGHLVRLPDVRSVRAARHRLRVPDGLPEGTP